MFFDNDKLQDIIALARKAGDVIVGHYNTTTAFKMKDDDTPITETDMLSHRILIEGLDDITLGIPILSEESGYIPFAERKKWDEYWLIDPLDGTRGFIDKTDDFCICLSYVKHNEIVFGLVYAPLQQVYYVANAKDIA